MHTTPTTHQTPARTKLPQPPQGAPRFHPHRLGVTLRTADAIGQNPEKHNRRGNAAQNEQAAKDQHEQRSVRHRVTPQAFVDQVMQRTGVGCSSNASEASLNRGPHFHKGHAVVDAFHADVHIATNRGAIKTARRDHRALAAARR